MREIAITTDRDKNCILVKYPVESDHALYDLCDEGGTILKSGTLKDGEAKICVESLEKGYFTLFVVDGDEMKRKSFKY